MKWLKASLLDICNPKQWPTISSKELTSSGYPVYGANGQIGYYHSYNHEEPTILVTCRGATCGTLNISPPKSYTTGNAMALDDIRSDLVDFKFLYYSLLSRGLKDTITGAAQPQITRKNLSIVNLSIPSLSEQKQIVKILDRADELRKQRAEADALSERILPALFIKMFGDPATNPMGWDVIKLGDLSEVQGGLQLTPKRKDNPLTLPYLRVANVYRNKLKLDEIKEINVTKEEVKRIALQKDDILIVEGHGNRDEIGRSAIWDNSIVSCLHQNHLIRVRVNKSQINPIYLNTFINSAGGREQLFKVGKTTSGLNTISVSNVRKINILVPPLESQINFAQKVDDFQRISEQREIANTKINELFDNLLYRAFSGDLTAQWREAHMTELLQEMEYQTKALNLQPTLF
ncbi:MAG: restriction endonuclease subunit S [Snowella sp.]|nr:restriction endonuclease subunit S [Snowella sp.]